MLALAYVIVRMIDRPVGSPSRDDEIVVLRVRELVASLA